MANHLTPAQLADEMKMTPSEVIEECVRMGVPIFNGRIDKTLFSSSLRSEAPPPAQRASAA